MAPSRFWRSAGVLIFVALSSAQPLCAHNVERVRRELTEQGFDQFEFQRTKPPFKLDACRDGERFHLHVDYYGKITEQTPLGSCTESSSADRTPSTELSPAPSKRKALPTKELCSRYFAEIGKTLQVPCE
jgi:hypothetical protein